MIKEAYCSFEVAKLLKEKGFNEMTELAYELEDGHIRNDLPVSYWRNSEIGKYKFSCPTHQMAMAWLREEYHIYINIQPDFPSDKDYKMCWCWSANILYENCISMKGYQCYIETYEEAVEAALKYVLEILI